jgi:hypothetical protein
VGVRTARRGARQGQRHDDHLLAARALLITCIVIFSTHPLI